MGRRGECGGKICQMGRASKRALGLSGVLGTETASDGSIIYYRVNDRHVYCHCNASDEDFTAEARLAVE